MPEPLICNANNVILVGSAVSSRYLYFVMLYDYYKFCTLQCFGAVIMDEIVFVCSSSIQHRASLIQLCPIVLSVY